MKIDIDGLSEDELTELNHKVVARLALPERDAVARRDARFSYR
jgi:hypothetical protein